MVDNYNFNVVPNDEQEEFKVEFGEIFKVVETDFNKLQNRPSYAGTMMTGDTNIPEVPTAVSQLTNDADYQTWAEVNSAIGVEAKARGDADDALQTAIGAVDGKVADEKTAREQADGVLQNNIEAEQTARQNADIGLQGQIDAITSASDVVDIVGTYAELQQYSTAKIKDNDVIKVLQDETHNNAMSYYRWSTSTSTWSYIGSEGPYYTKSESDTLLLAKQNKLTAGDNITITNDVISATDTNTTYTAGNAITIDSTDNNRIDAAIYPADFFTANATTSGTGSNITLNNTIPVKIDDVRLDGDTTQQTYSGKNLFDFPGLSDKTFTYGNVTLNELLSNGVVVTGATSTSTSATAFSKGRFMPAYNNVPQRVALTNDQTITVSADITIEQTGFANIVAIGIMRDGTDVKTGDENTLTVGQKTRVSQNFNISVDGNYYFYVTLASCKVRIENMMIELGSTVTDYEPYVGGIASPNPDYPQNVQVVTGEQTITISDGTNSQNYTVDLGSTELCKLGDYQDYIYKSGDDWYVHKETLKYVYSDSSQTVYFDSSIPRTSFYRPTGILTSVSYCNQLTSGDSATTNNVYNIAAERVFLRANEKMTSAADWNTWMGQNPLNFYFALATPTNTQITDNTLIGQLNALYGAQGYDDKTILTVSATGTNLPAILEVSAFAKSLEGIIDNAFIDTTYNVFTGTDGNTDGKSGLVPAPTTTDAGKFLKADGTWDTAGSPITVVQTIGTSTTDVMSQDATTKMVFENAKDTRIKIGNGASTHSGGAVAIGGEATASGANSIAIGPFGASAVGQRAISLGYVARTIRQGAIAIGYSTSAQGNGSIAIGGYSGDVDAAYVQNNKHGGIALGMGSQVTEVGEMNIGDRTSTYGYNSSAYRLLSGVYDGQNAHDAATVGQINATIDAINTALNTNIPHIGANN